MTMRIAGLSRKPTLAVEYVLDGISKLLNQLVLESSLLLDFLIYEINVLGVQVNSKWSFYYLWLGYPI